MPLKKLQLRPGIIRDVTNFTNEGGWYDADKVRFRLGMPESIGGWEKLPATNTLGYGGVCRALHQWTTLDSTQYTAIGTSVKLYIYDGTDYYDITPLRTTVTLPNNPFTPVSTMLSNTIIVNAPSHGCKDGDYVTFSGSTAVGLYPDTDFNREHIVSVIDSNSYRIRVETFLSFPPATPGGGAAVVAAYQINTGPADFSESTGWGIGTWGAGTWGTPRSSFLTNGQIRLWSIDNFGEDLVAAVRNGGIYVWDASAGTGTRAVELSSIPGANQAPTTCFGIQVSEVDRHLLVFGANENGSTQPDPLLVRWSDQEDLLEWEPRRNTTAGSQRVSSGSRITGFARARQETVIWTDIGLNSLTFVGPPYTFGLNATAQSVSLMGPKAVAEARNQLYWMDLNAFRFYNGSVNTLPCTVQAYVFDDFNLAQRDKVVAGNNGRFNEIWWFYPSANSMENDRYVTYNYVDNLWSIGKLSRTAWLDPSFSGYPIAASGGNSGIPGSGTFAQGGYLFEHEIGHNDDTMPMSSYIEGADLTLLEGENFAFISRIIPDFTKLGDNETGEITYQIKQRNFPQNATATGFSGALAATAELKELFVRVRTRQFALRVSADEINMGWRLGTTRFDIREDGRKL